MFRVADALELGRPCALHPVVLVRAFPAIEVLKLIRADVLLPRDLLQEARVAYLRIRSPKMRRIRARRECAKLDCLVLIRMFEVTVTGVAADTSLFSWTPSQMRKLHDDVVRFLGIPTVGGIGITPGSHRGGGATALFESTGSLDFVRWRGRWRLRSTSKRSVLCLSSRLYPNPRRTRFVCMPRKHAR